MESAVKGLLGQNPEENLGNCFLRQEKASVVDYFEKKNNKVRSKISLETKRFSSKK